MSEETRVAVEATGIAQRYGDASIFEALSLSVRLGELVAIAGPNGAGKSTLLRTLLGILPAKAGTVTLFGEDVSMLERAEIARLASFVPQGFSTDFELTVREMVAMGRTPHLGRFRLPGDDDRKKVQDALRVTELEALAERPFPELSGGERQRVVLARAFAQGGALLLLDEPTASLDLAHAYRLMHLVRGHVDAGGAALLAIHDLSLAARFADRLILLRAGKVHADGRPMEVLDPAVMREVFGVEAKVLSDGDDIALSVRGPAEGDAD